MMKMRSVFGICAGVFLGAVASLQAAVFQCDVYFDDASEKTLTFGLASTALEKPMPPDFSAVKYAWLQGSGNGDTVQMAEDYTRLSTQVYADATAATWTLNATSDIQMTFKGASLVEGAYLQIFEDDDDIPVDIADGTVFMAKAGESYCIQYRESRAVVPIPEAPEAVSVSYVTGATEVRVELDDPDEDNFEIAIDMSSLKAFNAAGEERLCSLSQISEDDWKVTITSDTVNFMFQYYFVSEQGGVRTQSALVTGTGTSMSLALEDVDTSSESSDVEEELRQVTVHPADNPVKVTLSYTYKLLTGLANPYIVVNTGTEAYAATAVSARVNGKAAVLAAQESPYEYKVALAAGEGTFSVSLDVSKDMGKHCIALLCGADGIEPSQEADYTILVAEFSMDFDKDGAITVDDANYLLNYRNNVAMRTYSTAGATEDEAEDAEEMIAAYDGSNLDFDGNGTADKTDAVMFYNYMTLGGTGNPIINYSLLIPDSAATGTKPEQAFTYFQNTVPALSPAASAAGILSIKADNYILNVSDKATLRVYAKSALPVQTLSFRVLLPAEHNPVDTLTVTMADITAEKVKYFTTVNEDMSRSIVEFDIVGGQGARTIPADTETLIATIEMGVDATGLAAGDALAVTSDYAFATRISGAKIELCETTDAAAGSIAVVAGVPATITATVNPKTPISEVSGKKGTSVDAAFTAYLDTTAQTSEVLKNATITKVHWYVKNSAGSVLADAWVDAKGNWSDEACTTKQGKAVADQWYIAGSKASVKNGLWTVKAKVTTAGFTTLNGADRSASEAYTLTAAVIDSLGGTTDKVWTIDITDMDQLAAAPALLQYSVNGGALVTKLPAVTAADSVVAYVKGKSGKEIVDAPEVDADGDAVVYQYAWYCTSKVADSDWKSAEDGGNVLPAHGCGQTWKLEARAFAKPNYAASAADTAYYSKSLKGASIKVANSAPTAQGITRTVDEECVLTIDLVGEGYVSDPDLPADTMTYALLNAQGKTVAAIEDGTYGKAYMDAATGVFTYLGNGKKGTDTITYVVTDKSKKNAVNTIQLTLTEVNDPPYFTIGNFYLTKSEYAQSQQVVIYAGRDYKDESSQKVTAATIALANADDAAYFSVAPAITTPAKGTNYEWLSTLSFTLKEDTPIGVAIPCTVTATDSLGEVGMASFSIVTGVTPWYPVHKAVFADKGADGITFKVKQVINGVVQKKILATVSVPKAADGSCVLTPELYYKANAKFTGLLPGETYYFEEYSYVLNKGKAKIDKACIAGCTENVDGTCETILSYVAPAASDASMTLVSTTLDKKGQLVYTFKVGVKLANSFVLMSINEKGKPAKTIKQNFVNFDEDGQMVQYAEVQLSFDKIVSVSLNGVNPAGTGEAKSFTVEELTTQSSDSRACVDDVLAAWPALWTDNAFFPKQGAVSFTEEALQNVTFTWPVSAAANGYELAVYDAEGALVASEKTVLSAADVQLAPGNYSWIVAAIGGDETAVSYGNTFSIVDHTDEPVVMAVTTATGSELAFEVINAAAGETVSFDVTYFDAGDGIWTTAAVEAAVDGNGVVLVDGIDVLAETYVTVQFGDGSITNAVIRQK